MSEPNYGELEQRLGRLDLQLSVRGEHLSDERLAEIASGSKVSDAEALHLAGCDECLEVLMALGEGLEDLSTEQPELSLLMTEPPLPRRRFTATTIALISLAACAMAATGWYVRGEMDALSPKPQATESQTAPSALPIAPPETKSPALVSPSRTEAPPAVSDLKPTTLKAVSLTDSPAAAETPPKREERGRSKPLSAAPVTASSEDKTGSTKPVSATLERGVERRVVKRKKSKVSPSSSPQQPESLAPKSTGEGLDERGGPAAFDRIAVDAAPRGFGQLRLNAKPAARVFIDGKDRGWTPIFDLRLQAGPHDVKLVFDSDLAEKREERFRVLIEADRIWSTVRDNRKKALRK